MTAEVCVLVCAMLWHIPASGAALRAADALKANDCTLNLCDVSLQLSVVPFTKAELSRKKIVSSDTTMVTIMSNRVE